MLWIARDVFCLWIATPIGSLTFALCLMFFDYFYSLPAYLANRFIHGKPKPQPEKRLPSGLVVIPSLLRSTDDLEAMKATVSNVIVNDYPGTLLVVASIDGYDDAPELFDDLRAWIGRQQSHLAADVFLDVTGTPKRRGKPLAIEHALHHVKSLVDQKIVYEFPKIYFSTDADADLAPHALEYIARRLCKPHWLTGSPGRAVAGNLYVRGNNYWQGWRKFFTVEGQLSIQVAREYLVTNIVRYNRRPFPISGTTGVLYCMWTDIFLEAPRFMGFMQSLRWRDWIRWWAGFGVLKFLMSIVVFILWLFVGDIDDTVSAFLAIIARWENGRFTLDAPKTPLHALAYAIRSFLIDRALRFEPEARVYTSSPTTLKTLWRQRVRWNTARIEVAGRFSRSYWFHWDLGVSALGLLALKLKYVFFGLFYYVILPLQLFNNNYLWGIAATFLLQITTYALWTWMALAMNSEVFKNWRLLLALPLAPLYTLVFSCWTTMFGAVHDIFLCGNITKFAPETTLIKGGSSRVALFARARRALILAVRAVVYGDVPFGAFWFGWSETPWTPSGYAGWSSGRKPSLRERLRYGSYRHTDASASRADRPSFRASTSPRRTSVSEAASEAFTGPAHGLAHGDAWATAAMLHAPSTSSATEAPNSMSSGVMLRATEARSTDAKSAAVNPAPASSRSAHQAA